MRRFICTTLAALLFATSVPTASFARLSEENNIGAEAVTMDTQQRSVSQFALSDSLLTKGSLQYMVIDGEEITIVKCDTSASGTVTIPSSIDGVPVTTIGTSAFYQCTLLTKVVIPQSVQNISTSAFAECTSLTAVEMTTGLKKIGYYAFSDCTSLKSVTIPQSVESIGEKPFRSCSSLETINVAVGNSYYTAVDGVLYDKACTKLIDYPSGKKNTEFTVPSGVKELGNYSFYEDENLLTLNIPDSVTKLGEQAIRGSKSLRKISIGAGVNALGNTVFTACEELKEIVVSPSNKAFSAEGGALYSKDRRVLYCVGGGVSGVFTIPDTVETVLGMSMASCKRIGEIKVPESVTSIEANAFRDCESLLDITVDENNDKYVSIDGVLFNKTKTTLICFPAGRGGAYAIPQGTTRLENYAFYGNNGLTSVDIPATVKEIGNYVFMASTSLQTAFFFGAVPQNFGDRVFENTDSGFAIYYMPEYRNSWAEGGRVVWNGYPIYELEKAGTDENGFEYIVADGYARIRAYKGMGGVVTVPANIDSYPVSMLYEGLFKSREDITSVTVEKGITVIPSNMFSACTSLELVSLPTTITTIGENAFYACASLTSVTLPSGIKEIPDGAFTACASLTRVTIPRTVERIGCESFYGCSSLKSVTIPANTQYIGEYAFGACRSLLEVSIGAGVSTLGDYAFYNCPNLTEAGFDAMPPANLGVSVFEKANASFKVSCFEEYMPYFDPFSSGKWQGYKIVLRDRVYEGFVYYAKEDNTIAIKTYRGEDTALSVPASINGVSVTSIDAGAFENTEAIVSIVIPDTVLTVGANAFAYCTSLKQVTIGKGVTAIGDRAFDGCDALASISVTSGNKHYASIDGALYDASMTKLILFPDAYTGNVVVPQSVKTILSYAFDNCKNITFVKLPEGLLSIGDNAFSACISLVNVVIPSTVTEIGDNAFRNCTSLKAACFKGAAPKFGKSVFSGVDVSFMIRYLASNTSSWKKQGTTYEGYDIVAFDTFNQIVLTENSTCRIDGAYIVNIPIKTIVVELSLIEITSNGIRVVNTEGKAQGDYSVICTGHRVQLVQSGIVMDEYSAAVLGDINGDGNISSRDIAPMQRAVAGTTVLFGAYFKAADMSGDSKVNSRDIALVQRALLGN
ncbi:MAG: leucine-rich repeat protein [Clostridia bacterium]|nr:leucine-rich repeat protein [Clostridia bacterium]